jgi:hypothetical protein
MEPNHARCRFNLMNERAEALGRKALQYERAASIATDPGACCAYLDLSHQLRAKAEEVEAFERVAYLRQGIWWPASGGLPGTKMTLVGLALTRESTDHAGNNPP